MSATKLTREQVLQIPELLKTRTIKEVAKELNVHFRTVSYWIKRLKDEGFEIPEKVSTGRPPLKLTE